jgi:Rps23 Pro-64 3,4-dihydroxylase Tpa1-like proline 4-hydroxylase
MIDRSRLAHWIQPRHLADGALAEYRRAFVTHPARMTVVREFLVPEVAERLASFLANEAEFRPEFGLYSIEGAVTEADWLRADDTDRLFRLGKLVGTPPEFRTSPNALTYLQFRMAFQRPEFKGFFEEISGMSLGASDDFGSHSMTEGDLLRAHSDDNRDRQLALVLYLTPGWRRQFGGLLRVVDPSGNHTDVEPEFNSMVAFDVLTAPAHLVSPVRPSADGPKRRLTIGGWYHKVGLAPGT